MSITWFVLGGLSWSASEYAIHRFVGHGPKREVPTSLLARATPLVARVRRHASLMVLLIRFAPGLRVAITSACAWVDVPALKFSILNCISACLWVLGLYERRVLNRPNSELEFTSAYRSQTKET